MPNPLVPISKKLLATSAVTDIVGTNVKPWKVIQYTDLPYITMRLQDDEEDLHSQGSSGGHDTEYEVHCWATTNAGAHALADAAIAALRSYNTDQSGYRFSVTGIRKNEAPEEAGDGADETIWRVVVLLDFWYRLIS